MNTSIVPDQLCQTMKEMWCENLQVTSASGDDNYFVCGGNSLTAIKLLSAIDRKLFVRLNYTDIYEYPTLSELSEHIATVIAERTGQEAVV